MNSITPAQLQDWLQQATDPAAPQALPVVLDVREDGEYKAGHILNSMHIPLGKLNERIGELEKHKDFEILNLYNHTPLSRPNPRAQIVLPPYYGTNPQNDYIFP